MRLQTKLGLAFAAVATGAIFAAVLLANLSVQQNFEQYVHQRHYAYYEQIANNLIRDYERTKAFSPASLDFFGRQALQEGYRLRLESETGSVIWESPSPATHGLAADENQWAFHRTELYTGNRFLGALYLLYPKTELTFAAAERAFLGQLYRGFGLAALTAGLLALLVSMFVGRYLLIPITLMRDAAVRLRSGDLTPTIPVNRRDEIGDLALAMNHLAESLRQQEELRKSLTADVAHELRTPLSTLQGYLEAFRDGVWSPTPERLDACHQQTLRLKNLVSDLESLASAEAGVAYNLAPLDFSELASDVCESMRPRLEAKGLSLDLSIREGLTVHGDARRLTQLIVNLVENAIKFNRPGGTVTVSVHSEGPTRAGCPADEGSPGKAPENLPPPVDAMAVLHVSDTGTGIAPADAPYVFERFFRGDKSRTRLTGGSGIGLAIVKAVAVAHGGSASIATTSEQGTTVEVMLPMVKQKDDGNG
ncbi:HAMP domain-containing protein [Heliobacterium gestii]|uniref:histidine kinase n=1 Tax=Heliomicrobium gestii TaxID=2699 RepID=A0A845LA64_HELGE|nr:ATP-binding protein [Heliomicrobium gestii]MBM7865298.1 signal transduction histidine kinase [Heliomicrobium gestii]MZP41559.1 HAMP domain-containing protein [Heliomicrobium gestii]